MKSDFEEPKSSNICLATLETNYDSMIQTWNGNNYPLITYKSYTQKHNYDFYYIKDKELVNNYDSVFNSELVKERKSTLGEFDFERPEAVYKISLILKLLKEKNYDYVFFIDSFDCLITNLDIKLESFLDSENSIFLSRSIPQYELKDEKELIQKNSPNSRIINTGFMAFENNESVFEFIRKAKTLVKNGFEFENDQDIIRRTLFSIDFSFIEKNVAINDPLKEKFWLYPNPNFNKKTIYRHPDMRKDLWKKGDFMIHILGFSGVPWEKLIPMFFKYTLDNNDLF